MMTLAAVCLLQVLLTLELEEPGPVRFGHPLPADAVHKGLRLQGEPSAVLQWRPLQEEPDPETGLIWVEIAIAGARGRVRLAAGGAGPGWAGPAYCLSEEQGEGPLPEIAVRRWRREWCTGQVEEWERWEWRDAGTLGEEQFDAGEWWTRPDAAADRRTAAVVRTRREWTRRRVLPADQGLGREYRRRLLATAGALRELPGIRGAGDYGRSGDTVTNLEFDTALALCRLGLSEGEPDLLLRALAAARHTLDRDLDRRVGLPFAHGAGHRTGLPEPGHAWLQGILLVGLLWADDQLIAGAGTIARGLAAHPPRPGPFERARDFAWPLLEMEAWLRFRHEAPVAAASERLAAAIAARWDATGRTFRFGEAGPGPVLLERAWITGGIVLPALRAHLARCPDAELQQRVDRAEARIAEQAASGLPTHWRYGRNGVFGHHRERSDPRAWLMLEGLDPGRLRGLLAQSQVARALGEVPDPGDPDLATTFTMLARCGWIYR